MASLQDTIRQNGKLLRGQGGTLSEEAPQTIQTLSGQAGLQAPPITPVGQGIIGANPNQQKMAGTPAQKNAAVQLASQPPQTDLATALREQQSRTQMTAQEQAKSQKSQDMQNLGSLGDRVNDFINVQRQKLQTAAGQGVQVQAQDQFQGKDLSTIKPLLQQLQSDPNNQQLMLQVNQALGYDVNTQLSPDQIGQLYESSVQSISRGAAGDVDNDLTVADLAKTPNFNYTPDQLSSLLGVPVAQLNTMTVGQLRDQINKVGSQEFSQSQKLDQQAQSGQLGQAERGLARQEGREASSTGIRATEADFSNLEKQISNADQVQFGGKAYKVDDLLKDDTISGIITDYMNSAPGSDVRKQLDQTEPQLSQFINKNQAVLDDAAKTLQGSATTFQATQAANKQITNLGPNANLDPALAQALIPGYGQLSANKIDPSTVPILQYASSLPDQQKSQFVNQLNTAQSKFNDIGNQLQGLSPAEIQNLGISDQPGTPWNSYVTAREQQQSIQGLDPRNLDGVLQAAYGISGVKEAQEGLTNERAMNTIGILKSGSGFSALDPQGTGKVSIDPSKLRDQMLGVISVPSLKDVAGGAAPRGWEQPSLGKPVVDPNPVSQSLLTKLGPKAADGYLDSNDLQGANLEPQEIVYLKQLSDNGQGKLNKDTLNSMWNDATQKLSKQYLSDLSTQGLSPAQEKAAIEDYMRHNSGDQNSAVLQARLAQLNTAPETGSSMSNVNPTLGGRLSGAAVGSLAGQAVAGPAGAAVGAVSGGGGCFIAGTLFKMEDNICPIEFIQPGDRMLSGGKVIATAQFLAPHIYLYNEVLVSGTHAVLEDGEWIRVADSDLAQYMPNMDNSKVYVVWNAEHRMIAHNGIVFADYAETDSSVADIERQRNLDILNGRH